jgi:hypothetical protein
VRLWSLHPSLLDTVGLVALWREGLLARAVLAGRTRGYRHHPQLERFRAVRASLRAIDCYLSAVLDEAEARGYAFDASKIVRRRCRGGHAVVASGQLAFEWRHLLDKLSARDPERFRSQRRRAPRPHPCFEVVDGGPAPWERAALTRAAPARRPR